LFLAEQIIGEQMNLKRFAQKFVAFGGATPSVAFCISTLDKGVFALGTALLIAGVLGAALEIETTPDYLFAGGLLLHFTIWFEGWWLSSRTS
jgi:hypothetical protein